jgi:isoleucyl-tRNA synthetase
VQRLVREADPEQATGWARQLIDGKAINVNYDGPDGSPKTAVLASDDVEVRRTAASGFAIKEDGGYLVALKTELTPELEAEGLTRETVRRIQVMRRDADFALDDRIALTYQASDKLARALAQFADYLRAETLADQVEIGTPSNGQTFKFEDGETITVGIKRLNGTHA